MVASYERVLSFRFRRKSLLALVLLVPVAQAAVTKSADYTLPAKPVRGGLFDLAVTPAGAVLSFIARNSGTWQLYRVRDWQQKTPTQEKLLLPGFFSNKDRKDLETLDAHVFVTADGKYAVCVASAEWVRRAGGVTADTPRSDDVIATVDLTSFRVVATTHTEPIGLFAYHRVLLDTEGKLGISSLSAGSGRRGALVRLSLPDLTPGRRCAYQWSGNAAGRAHPEAVDADGCQAALGSLSLDQYLQSQLPSFSFPAVCEGSKAEFCSLPDVFTGAAAFSPDGKYAVAERIERRNDALDGAVTTSFSYVVFSTAKKADIGEVKEPVKATLHRVLASVDGQDYLVVLQDGTHLTAYLLQE